MERWGENNLGGTYTNLLTWMDGAVDVEGEPRILNGAVNMGAYARLLGTPGAFLLVR